MKFFAIYANVHITSKPPWLDKFRTEYDVAYDEHITLTQPRYIHDNDIASLKDVFTSFLDSTNYRPLELTCSRVYLDRQDEIENGCIMVAADNSPDIHGLQRELKQQILKHDNFYAEKNRAYEENFVPHITIARDLSGPRFDAALSELPREFSIKAILGEITLAIVNDESAEERTNPDNLTVYDLTGHRVVTTAT